VALCVVDEGANVNTFWWVANTRTHSDGDFFIVVLVEWLVKVVGERGSIVKRNIDTFS
jgi:hypothetical protein